jgi:hypothetical protein
MDAELLEAARNTRIQNFYKSKNGKLNSVSFQSVKEKQASRTINKLHYNGETVTDPDRIIQIMQEWYEHTANAAQPQLETLENFLADQQIELPKIGQDLQDMLIEEISSLKNPYLYSPRPLTTVFAKPLRISLPPPPPEGSLALLMLGRFLDKAARSARNFPNFGKLGFELFEKLAKITKRVYLGLTNTTFLYYEF